MERRKQPDAGGEPNKRAADSNFRFIEAVLSKVVDDKRPFPPAEYRRIDKSRKPDLAGPRRQCICPELGSGALLRPADASTTKRCNKRSCLPRWLGGPSL